MVYAVVIAYVLIYLLALAISLWIGFVVTRSAVRAALFDHYKIVRWFELTGEWRTDPESYKKAPRDVALAGMSGTHHPRATQPLPPSTSDDLTDYY